MAGRRFLVWLDLLADISANLGGLGVAINGSLAGLGAELTAILGAGLPALPSLTGLIQTGEALAANFAAQLGAGFNGLIQTGETLTANLTIPTNMPPAPLAADDASAAPPPPP